MRGFRPKGEPDLVFVPLKDRTFFRVRAAKCARLRRASGR
jgi:hypothetical protein